MKYRIVSSKLSEGLRDSIRCSQKNKKNTGFPQLSNSGEAELKLLPSSKLWSN